MPATLDRFPLRLVLNGEDVSFEVGSGFSFSNTDPGGFEAASFPIPRDMPYLKRGEPVRLECGLSTAWEGRVKEIQRSLGAKTLIQCEGNAAILKENSRAEIFVDRDLTHWASTSVARRIRVQESGSVEGSWDVANDSNGNPSFAFALPGAYTGIPIVENLYYADGLKPAYLYLSQFAQSMPASWSMTLWTWPEQDGKGSVLIDGWTTSPHSGYEVIGTPQPYLSLQASAPSTTNTSNANYLSSFSNVATYGPHGLTRRGSDPGGFWPSDIAAFVANACPGIGRGVIEDSSGFVVPHAVYYLPVADEQIIADMARFAGWHWGVWESLTYLTGAQTPRLDFRAGPSEGEATSWAWRKECDQLDIREDLENLYNEATVSYSEPGGEERSVSVMLTNPELDAVSLDRTLPLNFGIGTEASAKAWGLIQLRLLADQARNSGSASIIDPIHKPTGAAMPAWMLRAGLDRLRIPDLPCDDVWGAHNDLPIRRVECSGSDRGLVTSIEFGNAINLIETLAAQMQANLTASGS